MKNLGYNIKFEDGTYLMKGCPRHHRNGTYSLTKTKRQSDARVFKSYIGAEMVAELLSSSIFDLSCLIEPLSV